MRKQIVIFFLLATVVSSGAQAQCSYNIINISHIDCYDDNTGEILVSIANPNSTYWWSLPGGGTSANVTLSNLFAGDYVLNIMENFIPGDTSSAVICFISDTISVQQTIEITAEFMLKNICSPTDSADVFTNIYGGTRPYSTLWTQIGDTARNITNIAASTTPYTLNITDANGCQNNQYLIVNQVENMQTFMSVEDVICKDDNSGSARIYVENGTSPFVFIWNTGEIFLEESASQINNLYPGMYSVSIKDTMGCLTSDSIELSTNPEICITIYKVFSPNEDGIHDFWEIKNIHLYPEALVEVYDRLGNRVYRRRNYINSESIAFNGKINDRRLPSGTYYYIVDLENEEEIFKGTLTIIR